MSELAQVTLPNGGTAYVHPTGELAYTQGDGITCPKCRVNNRTNADKCVSCGAALR